MSEKRWKGVGVQEKIQETRKKKAHERRPRRGEAQRRDGGVEGEEKEENGSVGRGDGMENDLGEQVHEEEGRTGEREMGRKMESEEEVGRKGKCAKTLNVGRGRREGGGRGRN